MGIRQADKAPEFDSGRVKLITLVRIQHAQLSGYGGTADAEDSKSSGEIRVGSSPTIRIRLIFVSKLLKRKVIENKIRPKVITLARVVIWNRAKLGLQYTGCMVWVYKCIKCRRKNLLLKISE